MNKKDLLISLRSQNFSDLIVSAFEKVERERFLSPKLINMAYLDSALPLDCQQTISQPSMIAWMLQLLDLESLIGKKCRILEVGSGSGYVLALLAETLPKAEIYGLEIQLSLFSKSKSLLSENKNIQIMHKSGHLGFPEKAPFSRIIVSASAPDEKSLNSLVRQLDARGILVAPVRNDLIKITKLGKGKLEKKLFPNSVRFVPLIKK